MPRQVVETRGERPQKKGGDLVAVPNRGPLTHTRNKYQPQKPTPTPSIPKKMTQRLHVEGWRGDGCAKSGAKGDPKSKIENRQGSVGG